MALARRRAQAAGASTIIASTGGNSISRIVIGTELGQTRSTIQSLGSNVTNMFLSCPRRSVDNTKMLGHVHIEHRAFGPNVI